MTNQYSWNWCGVGCFGNGDCLEEYQMVFGYSWTQYFVLSAGLAIGSKEIWARQFIEGCLDQWVRWLALVPVGELFWRLRDMLDLISLDVFPFFL